MSQVHKAKNPESGEDGMPGGWEKTGRSEPDDPAWPENFVVTTPHLLAQDSGLTLSLHKR